MRLQLAGWLFCAGLVLLTGCEKKSPCCATIAGGVSETAIQDADVKAAADYAVATLANQSKEPLTLKKIIAAKSQIVAGTNYYLTLQVAGAKTTQLDVVIWKKLDGTYELTKSTWLN